MPEESLFPLTVRNVHTVFEPRNGVRHNALLTCLSREKYGTSRTDTKVFLERFSEVMVLLANTFTCMAKLLTVTMEEADRLMDRSTSCTDFLTEVAGNINRPPSLSDRPLLIEPYLNTLEWTNYTDDVSLIKGDLTGKCTGSIVVNASDKKTLLSIINRLVIDIGSISRTFRWFMDLDDTSPDAVTMEHLLTLVGVTGSYTQNRLVRVIVGGHKARTTTLRQMEQALEEVEPWESDIPGATMQVLQLTKQMRIKREQLRNGRMALYSLYPGVKEGLERMTRKAEWHPIVNDWSVGRNLQILQRLFESGILTTKD